MFSRAMPASSRTFRIGGSSVAFGTGRVMSLTTIQAVFLPAAISDSGGEPIGSRSILPMDALALRSTGAFVGSSTPTKPGVSGRFTFSPRKPYFNFIFMPQF